MIADSGLGVRESSKDALVLLELARVSLHRYERSVGKVVPNVHFGLEVSRTPSSIRYHGK